MEDSCRPFPGHLDGDVPPEKVKPAYYNSIPVVDKWLEDLQASHFDDAAEAWKLARYLRLAVGMLCSEPGDRISSWEAVLDFYDVLHPDAKDSDRLSMAKEFVQAPHKPRTDGSLAETPLHRAARNGDFCRVVCLVDEGWKVDDTDVNHKTPIVLAKEAGHDLIESYLEIKRVKRDGTSSNIFPTAYVHEIEMDRRGFRTRTSSSKPPSSSIWTSSILHPEVQEIPQGAEEALQWFLGDELTMLYFYEYVKDETAWLYPASHMLAYMLRQRGNHVIVLDIGHDVVSTGKEIFTTFGSALLSCFTVIPPRNLPRTVQDLDNILEQYCPPSRPITVIMLGIKNRSFTTDILNIITFVLRHCVKSGNGLVNFKAFLTSEDWSAEIGSIVPAHQHVDLSELSNTVAWWGEDLNLGK
ncbi:hypothetical protein AA0117_g3486 [Alternaria alternata]|uniref:Uncharacterized protein n=1 Tax=Alternaria alternata TaxID=5599 RepID=A0A4Q4NMD3_ALTAL|nr:hypothetical protein AA0117_g3486 [Alternaria alternata]